MSEDSENLVEWMQRYQRPLTIGAIVVALGVGGWWWTGRSAAIREARAGEALQVGETLQMTGNVAGAQTEFARVATRYAGTSAGAQAAMISAQAYFEEGKLEEGLAALEPAVRRSPRHLRAGILALRAAGEAMAGRPAEAAASYEAAAGATSFRHEREQYQMDAARQWVAASNFAAARGLYEAISGREDSGFAAEARLRLGELIGKA